MKLTTTRANQKEVNLQRAEHLINCIS